MPPGSGRVSALQQFQDSYASVFRCGASCSQKGGSAFPHTSASGKLETGLINWWSPEEPLPLTVTRKPARSTFAVLYDTDDDSDDEDVA